MQPRSLCLVEKGLGWANGRLVRTGFVWGEDMILETAALRREVTVVCLTFLDMQFIDTDTFAGCIARRPMEKVRIRRSVCLLALQRGIVREARRRRGDPLSPLVRFRLGDRAAPLVPTPTLRSVDDPDAAAGPAPPAQRPQGASIPVGPTFAQVVKKRAKDDLSGVVQEARGDTGS